MKDLADPRWIKFKGILFVIVGLCSGALLLLDNLTLKTAVLLSITIWCFCRAYYFAFYVIEHYVDPGFHFSGLGAFVKYMIRSRRANAPANRPE